MKTQFGYQNGYQQRFGHHPKRTNDQRFRWSEWWAVRDSNPRPPARHGTPHGFMEFFKVPVRPVKQLFC